MTTALFDNNLDTDGTSYLFSDPVEHIICHSVTEISRLFERIGQAQKAGHYVAGYFAYEMARYFGFAVPGDQEKRQVLASIGIFKSMAEIASHEVDAFLHARQGNGPSYVYDVRRRITPETYGQRIDAIIAHLRAGDSYQVNYTIRNALRVAGSVFDLYPKLRASQPVAYGALLDFPDQKVLSRSPELFFEKRGPHLRVRPMKGTAPRDPDKDDPQSIRQKLVSDPKQVSENIMIVDLLRNDLGTIAETGTVQVDSLLDIETYKTLYQMTSSISCQVDAQMDVKSIFAALFPCGSITGAPKKRTCEIIADLEDEARGVYCGAIGFIKPDNDMCFNVPIRTLCVDADNRGQFGVGSGIVYESIAENEYEECLTKGRFMLMHKPDFDVIDTFLFTPSEGRRNYAMHIERLAKTCDVFGYPYHPQEVEAGVAAALRGRDTPHKVRIAIDKQGEITVTASALQEWPDGRPRKVAISDIRLDSSDPRLRYKTSDRAFYDDELARWRASHGVYDVLFCNETGYLSEASFHNVVVRQGDTYYTPSLDCGVLDGIGRRLFLERHKGHVIEGKITPETLYSACQVLLVSSVRGVCQVEVMDHG